MQAMHCRMHAYLLLLTSLQKHEMRAHTVLSCAAFQPQSCLVRKSVAGCPQWAHVSHADVTYAGHQPASWYPLGQVPHAP